MTSFPDPVQSTALVVYNPQAHPLAKAKAHMQEMQDLFMARSFKAQVSDYQAFRRSWNGNVIVLAGGSSAGKSTIINALKSLDRGMVEEGSDLTGANFTMNSWRKIMISLA
jgi:putative ribosome biogenesis GTPase RsgA